MWKRFAIESVKVKSSGHDKKEKWSQEVKEVFGNDMAALDYLFLILALDFAEGFECDFTKKSILEELLV